MAASACEGQPEGKRGERVQGGVVTAVPAAARVHWRSHHVVGSAVLPTP